MLRPILSISGRPGLYRLVSQGKNMLIVESLKDKRRFPAYANDKVISLGDISIYTDNGDVALADVLEKVKEKNEGKAVNVKGIANVEAVREYFGEILPDFDRERVYTTDIKKLLNWYNALIEAGITDFKEEVVSAEKPEETAEEAATEE